MKTVAHPQVQPKGHLFSRLGSAREDLKFVFIINLWSSKALKIARSDRVPQNLFLTSEMKDPWHIRPPKLTLKPLQPASLLLECVVFLEVGPG